VERAEQLPAQPKGGEGTADLIERECEIGMRDMAKESVGAQSSEREIRHPPAEHDDMGIHWECADELLECAERPSILDALKIVNDEGQTAGKCVKAVLD